MTASFQKMATVTASTKRSSKVGGKYGEPLTVLTGLKIIPLSPATAEQVIKYNIAAPVQPLVTYVEGSEDVRLDDYMTVGSQDYLIAGVGEWSDALTFREIVIDRITE